jgi:hypothetical protein
MLRLPFRADGYLSVDLSTWFSASRYGPASHIPRNFIVPQAARYLASFHPMLVFCCARIILADDFKKRVIVVRDRGGEFIHMA